MTITNYHCTKRGKSAVDSDHVTMMLKMNLKVLPHKPQIIEMFDFKNREGQILFKKKTSETKEFTDCFENMSPLLENCERWNDKLKSYCKKSYPIIRIRNKNSATSAAVSSLIHAINLKRKLMRDILVIKMIFINLKNRLQKS